MSTPPNPRGKGMEGWDFEIYINGMPTRQKFVAGDKVKPDTIVKSDGKPLEHMSSVTFTAESENLGAWHGETLLIGQCEWCGKDATGDPKSTPFLCKDCVTHPDRPPTILCSQCGAPFTEIIGVSRKWFRCAPCKRELGR